MTMDDRCFICGLRIGRGNQPAIGIHEQMSKLVSVSQTVEHSSTIISDILSRILNETVMHEETICRICFNLLNDIDYHLKEAQEKTDEITNKFLDKGKDPLSYNPQPIVMAAMSEASDPEETQQVSTSKRESSRHARRSRRRKGHQFFADNSTDAPLTEDEMSVNMINKNKAKLLSHVLNPKSKMKLDSRENAEALPEENTEELDEDDEEYHEPKSKRKKREKSRRRKRRTSSGSAHSDELTEHQVMHHAGDGSELATVNMDDLGDLLSKPRTVYFAKKSEPPTASKTDVTTTSPITCEYCQKTFKKKTNLQLHMEKVHVSQAPVFAVVSVDIPETHKCHLCPREFTNVKSLMIHKDEHTKGLLESTTLQPSSANKVVKSPTNEAEVKATCPQCNKTFRRHFNMRIHIDRVHNKLRLFPCKSCDKTFATNSDLKQHLTVHGQGKKFSCEECGRSFTNRDSIILHRKQHSNQRTHFCVVCEKGFFKASCLNRHMRTHTGERPYKCDHCRKGFSQSTTLKIHKEKCSKHPQNQRGKERSILGV